MDARLDPWAGVEVAREPRHCIARARNKDRRVQAQCFPIRIRPEYRGPRMTLPETVRVFRIHRDGELVGARLLRLCDAGDTDLAVALNPRIQRSRDFRDGMVHAQVPQGARCPVGI